MDATSPSARVDVAFHVRGVTLPHDHGAPLAAALERALPWLAGDQRWGLHRLRLAEVQDGEHRVSPRTRLVLRVPREWAQPVLALSGQPLNVAGHALEIGAGQVRELRPHGTLYAYFVAADNADEGAFLTEANAQLTRLGVRARPICGRWRSQVSPLLVGCSLMLDGLSPEDALRVLAHGLGRHRRLGCGLFVPHKSSAAVGTAT